MRAFGFAFNDSFFAPHFGFRFPKFWDVTYGGVNLGIRQAFEPWHVPGEEGTPVGMARYVDNSLERIQIMAKGRVPGQHAI